LSDPSTLFRELQAEYYQAWLRFHPESSVDVGVSDHAHLLRSYNEDDIGALIALNHKLISALDEMNTAGFDAQLDIDYRILQGAASIELHELEEQNWRYRDPMQYVPLYAIHQLLTHPVKNVHKALKQRLEAIPEYLRGARTLLLQAPEYVVPEWLQTAVIQCQAGKDYLRDLGRNPLISRLFTNPAKLQPLLDTAANAMDEYARFLEADILPHAQGDFACGSHHFNRLLNQKHFLATDAAQVLSLGERLLARHKQLLREHTQTMQGDDDVFGLLKKIQSQHPQAKQLLDVYRERMRLTHQWLEHNDLVSLPGRQSLKVQETPSFMQALIPFAAYDPPSVSDADQHGYYYVTLPQGDAITEHNDSSIDLTCVHEAFPGHHLQFVTANQVNAGNHTRLLNASASMYEGWALYTEQLAIEQGLLDKDEHRFMMLRDRVWRCLRIIIDVKLQSGNMTLQQAADLLVAELGFDRAQAEAEVSWYSSEAATPLCYATGCEMILAARDNIVTRGSAGLKTFHDGLLAQGSIALPLVLEHNYGEAIWRRIHTAVFE
jgi:uncharacterized protein (DUF885 family)